MNPGNTPDTKTTGPVQTTPHTESEQNQDAGLDGLEATLAAVESGDLDDSALVRDGYDAQSGTGRSFARNSIHTPSHKVEPFTAAEDNPNATRTPHSDNQGITNHSSNVEAESQEKVVSERPDSLAGVSKGDTL